MTRHGGKVHLCEELLEGGWPCPMIAAGTDGMFRRKCEDHGGMPLRPLPGQLGMELEEDR